MRTYPHKLVADAKEERRQGERAFTMIEIAIAIGVIGFALVAVIGVLPTGMNVQKDNREDTTISQDAPFFIDSIRNGGNFTNAFINHGLDFLTNYVEKIMLIGVSNGVTEANAYQVYTEFESGAEIIGLLSTPESLNVNASNYSITRAIVRSLSSPAVQQNGGNQITAFRYQMDIQIVPFVLDVAPDSTNYLLKVDGQRVYPDGTPECLILSNRWEEVNIGAFTNVNGSIYLPQAPGSLVYSCYDMRVHFSWPVIPSAGDVPPAVVNQPVGPGRQSYRTTISSALVESFFHPRAGEDLWFFQPQLYAIQPTQQ
jgi:type II secretory pathway pseudopilin PulG